MADLAAFASGVVHDIRNPLNVIRSNVYLLRQRLPEEDARGRRAVERIDDQVTAAMRLLEGLQAFYRSDQPSLQSVSLNELLQSVAGTTTVPEGTEVTVGAVDSIPPVPADPQLLDAALRALVRNAMEAMPAGGKVRLEARLEGERAQILVQDSGPGIEEAARAGAFEPFVTTRRGHAGLGLAMVAKVARAHGGRAYVAAGPGTCVVVELPLSR
jgi:signal transduction histidine kinase